MKKILTLIFSCLVCSVSYAQPSFTTVAVPVEGYSYETSSIIYNDTDPAFGNGASMSWDYNTLAFNTSGTTTTWHTNLSSATYGGFFSTATHYVNNVSNHEVYYQNTSTSRSELGLFDGTSVIQYNSPLVLVAYPIAYTDVQNRTYSCSFTQNSYPSTLNGTLSTTYDGYGTLTVGTQVTSNIGRYKIVRDQTIATSFSSVRTITTTYAWYIPGEFIPRFAIEYVATTVDGNPSSSSHKAYQYTENIATAVSKAQEVNARLYPQPASEIVTVEAPDMIGTIGYSIFKMDGTAIAKEQIEADGSGSMVMNISSIPSGLYMIELVNGNKLVKQKLIVK